MVDQPDIQCFAKFGQLPSSGDIKRTWSAISGRVVVRDHHRLRPAVEGSGKQIARPQAQYGTAAAGDGTGSETATRCIEEQRVKMLAAWVCDRKSVPEMRDHRDQ